MGGWLFRKKKNRKNLIIPAANGQLEKTNLGGSDMDSGHVGGSISNNKYKSCIKNLYFIALLDYSRKSPKYIKSVIYPLTLFPPLGGCYISSAQWALANFKGFWEATLLGSNTGKQQLTTFGPAPTTQPHWEAKGSKTTFLTTFGPAPTSPIHE